MPEPSRAVADEFFPGLVRVLSLLEPSLSDVVLVGGWVPYLMTSMNRDEGSNEPLLTRDIDIAVPRELKTGGDRMDQLLRGSGLEYSYRSMFDPPVVSFVGTLEGCEVEVEFLTDEPGAEERVLDVGGGLRVQSLHYTNILLDNTMTIPISKPDGTLLPVRLPTPAAFVFNKGLTFVQRKTPLKKAKDLYYVFGVLDSHQESLSKLADDTGELGERYPTWFRRFTTNLSSRFERVDDEGVRMVVSQRPTQAFVDLNDDQFAQYVFVTFREFLAYLGSGRATP
jgi:hypothetical protein